MSSKRFLDKGIKSNILKALWLSYKSLRYSLSGEEL